MPAVVDFPSKQTRSTSFLSRISQPLYQFCCQSTRLVSSTGLRAVVLTSLTATGVILGSCRFGGLQPFELAVFDWMVRSRPEQSSDPRLLVVSVTEADIRTQHRWPLSDQIVARTLEILQQYQPRAIGLDLFRDLPNGVGRQALLAQLHQPNVVAITYLGNFRSERVLPPPTLPEAQIGFSDLVTDPDGVVRRNLMFIADDDTTYTSFATQLALTYLAQGCGKGSPQIPRGTSATTQPPCEETAARLTETGEFQLGDTVFSKLRSNSGGYQKIDAGGYQILLDYRSPGGSVRQVTLQQVLNREIDPSWVRDKVVLIGSTAPSTKDLLFTPYSAALPQNRQMSGVLVHAQMVSQLLSAVLDGHPLIWFWSEEMELLWIAGWAITGSILAWRVRHWLLLCFGIALSLGILVTLGAGMFVQSGWVPLVAPALALMLSSTSIVTYRLLYTAFHDDLTGLPNRALFMKRLRRAIARTSGSTSMGVTPEHQAQVAVLFLDLDRFKVVNDNLGHRIGDTLLIHCSQRLNDCLQGKNTLARVGGDEFAILLEDICHINQVTDVADRLQEDMALPFRLREQEIFTSVSMGIALSHTEGCDRPEDLLRDAHTAMYQAKAAGRARREIFATGMRMRVVKQLQVETDLRRAIEQQEFELFYQPIVALLTGQTAGFEALVRWRHPQRGLISPAEFIPVAEETGLIVPLGQWILETACRQLKRWQAQFPTDPLLMVSVNLSGRQFTQPGLVEFIEKTLTANDLEGRNLKLEITESVAMSDVEAAITMLERLKALGLQLSIDDFGTGYSSLNYLHRFPVTTLKVDRSFVSHMDDSGDNAVIVQAIVGLAHNLGMNVVAEGVETAAQLAKLHALQCEYGQGYLFSKPVPTQEAENLLASNLRWLER
jgi:diguanylate cyclase (GGDEF)-like protein